MIMRTHAQGIYCLTANALGAGVRQDAHFFGLGCCKNLLKKFQLF